MKALNIYILTEEELKSRTILKSGDLASAINTLLPIQLIERADFIAVNWDDGTTSVVIDKISRDPRKYRAVTYIVENNFDSNPPKPKK